jgi:predicted nucleic acid-binding protein
MITAVDTNVLIDVLANDPRYAERSLAALRRCQQDGRLVICEIVLAEIARYFPSVADLRSVLSRLDISAEAFGDEVCFRAGAAFQRYRRLGGSRNRILADFLIAAHAQLKCARLLTRDRGFYRDYFPDLAVVDPGQD